MCAWPPDCKRRQFSDTTGTAGELGGGDSTPQLMIPLVLHPRCCYSCTRDTKQVSACQEKLALPRHGRPHIGANGVSWPPLENGWKIKKRKHATKRSFLYLCYILRAIRAGSCRERRYVDHIFIQIYFRMHHFVVNFSKFSSPQAASGHWPPNQNPADVPVRRPSS